MMRPGIDLHVHSKFSGDNDSDPEESVIRAIELNLRGIAFTEHYSYRASEHVEKLREKYRGSIMLFRGVEYSAEEGHCLIFGVDTDRLLPVHAPARDVIAMVTEGGGVVIPSHPYRGGASLGDLIKNLSGLCAIEGYNGCNLHAFNIKAIEAAHFLQVPFTGGSDAHAPQEVGSCYTVFDGDFCESDLVTALRTGAYRGVDNRKISRTWMV